jgi:predicted peptidase
MAIRSNRLRFLPIAAIFLPLVLATFAPAKDAPGPAASAVGSPVQTGQHPGHFEKQITIELNYLLYLPDDYAKDPDKKWPLIFFLHGSGERGTNLNMVKRYGPPKIVEAHKDFPFVVVSPQCPPDTGWHTLELNGLLDQILADYHVDPDRVYLTGLSMGGFETWDWAVQNADRFAAIAPMCGGSNVSMAHRLTNLPIWVFHGDADPVVPVARSDEMVAALKALGADVTYTRYPGVGHDCWTRSYDNPDLYTWFLSHHRGEARTPTTAPTTQSN